MSGSKKVHWQSIDALRGLPRFGFLDYAAFFSFGYGYLHRCPWRSARDFP